jgi:hypothetical protein
MEIEQRFQSVTSDLEHATRKLVEWRRKDRVYLANKQDDDAKRAEYNARNILRGAADKVEKAGQS